jgi:peroxiredoxin
MAASRSRARGRPTGGRRAPAAAAQRPLLLPLVLVLVVLVLLGGGLAAWHALSPASVPPAATGTGPLAPAIDAPTVDGGRFSLAAQRGKVVVLYAMAAWCTSCVPETTALGQLAQTDGRRGVVTLLVDESPQTDSPAAVQDFRARTQGPARSWVIDQGTAIAQAYGITSLDTTVVIDRTGHIAARYGSSIDLATLQAAVRPLL